MRPADNPFRSTRMDALAYRFPEGDLQALWQRLEAQGHRGAIVGPMGSGKTTLLRLLARRYAEAGRPTVHAKMPAGCGQPPATLLAHWRRSLTPDHVLLLDGMEQLSRLGWWRLQRALPAGSGLVATSHVAARLPVIWRTRTTPALLDALAAQLCPADLPLPDGLTARLYAEHRGDLRQCLRGLYDYCAALA